MGSFAQFNEKKFTRPYWIPQSLSDFFSYWTVGKSSLILHLSSELQIKELITLTVGRIF